VLVRHDLETEHGASGGTHAASNMNLQFRSFPGHTEMHGRPRFSNDVRLSKSAALTPVTVTNVETSRTITAVTDAEKLLRPGTKRHSMPLALGVSRE